MYRVMEKLAQKNEIIEKQRINGRKSATTRNEKIILLKGKQKNKKNND